MKTYLIAAGIAALAVAGLIVYGMKAEQTSLTDADFTGEALYQCQGGKTLGLAFADGIARVSLSDKRVFTLERTEEGESGVKFSNDGDQIVLWTKDSSAFLIEEGVETHAGCVSSAAAGAGDPTDFTDASGMFRVRVPAGWYAHALDLNQTIFTPSAQFTLPQGTEGYAIGNQMAVRRGSFAEIVGAKTAEDYLKGIGLTKESEFFVERSEMTRAGMLSMTRGVLNAAAADGQTLLYVYFPGGTEVILFSHYPYVAGSDSARAFEELVDSFVLLKQ